MARPKPPRCLPIGNNFLWEHDSASSVKALTQGLRNVVILLERFCTRACAFTPTRKQRKLICIGHRSNERFLPPCLQPNPLKISRDTFRDRRCTDRYSCIFQSSIIRKLLSRYRVRLCYKKHSIYKKLYGLNLRKKKKKGNDFRSSLLFHSRSNATGREKSYLFKQEDGNER